MADHGASQGGCQQEWLIDSQTQIYQHDNILLGKLSQERELGVIAG